MICVMARAPCISVVRVRSLSNYSFEKLCVRFAPRFLPGPLTLSRHLGRSIFRLLIVLSYHMFTLCFLGLALGGVWGVREGARRPLAVSNTRLRINSVLNSVTRRGTFIGNSAGVLGPSSLFFGPILVDVLSSILFLALLYNGVNSSIDAMRGKHDILGSMGAGAVTGALFKSTGTCLRFS